MKKLFTIVLFAGLIWSCKKHTTEPQTPVTQFSNVLILGNSITYSEQNLSIGWQGNWGMAATVPDSDYVHRLTAGLRTLNPNCKVQAVNISQFELSYDTYDFDANLKTYRDAKPDLLVLRIGENVQSSFDSVAFAKRYQALIAYMKTGNSSLKVLAAGSFWPQREYINVIMSRYTPYLSLAYLGNDISNYAFDLQGVDASVQGHPGNKGMRGIADALFEKIKQMR